MEAASRPSLELLADLPLEEPLDVAVAPQELPTAAPAAPVAAPVTASAAPAKDQEQADLNLLDPEAFFAPHDPAAAVPVAVPAGAALAPAPALELALEEDPFVDELLARPTPAPVPPAASPATVKPAPPGSARAASNASSDAQLRPMRVPIAKTPALAAAAAKLAAAGAAYQRYPSKAPSNPPVVPAARRAPLTIAAAPPKPEPPRVEPPRAEPPRVEPPSFASWASARAAAAPATKAVSAPVAPVAPVATAPSAIASATAAKSVTPKAAAPAAAPAPPQPAPVAASAPMDLDFIARNQVVERYLSGRLPLKGATDFERFCHQHPELLDQIGLPERVNAGVRLLEASGKPEPWREPARPLWQKPQVTLGLAAAAAILGVALAIVAGSSAAQSHRIIALQKQAFERALDPATSTREIRVLPSRSGASNTPAITIGGGSTQLADFKIDESRSPFHSFRVTIDRIDQGRVAVLTNLTKDSNGHLRIALNSSALGPGNYQLTIEGLGWRGDPEPDSWITIGIVR
ncbi:MAG TPA: hypothetical protein VGD47_01815 [Steroidobacteraceae bacterium]